MAKMTRPAWLALAAAFALRLGAAAYYYRVPLTPGGDDAQYAEIAANLADGSGYRFHGAPTAYRLPLYPFVLAALRRLGARSEGAARLAQAFVGCATVWLAFQLGAAAAGPAAGLAAMVLTALDPTQVLLGTSLYSECVFGALVLLVAWALAAYWARPDGPRAATLGAAAGLSALCRSTLLLVPLLAPAFSGQPLRRRLGHAAAAACAAALLLSPWLWRNAVVFHRLIPAESGVIGPVLYYGSEGRVTAPEREDGPEPMRTMYRTLPSTEWDGFALRLAAANVRQRPGRYLASVAARAWRLWSDSYLCYLIYYHPAQARAMQTGRRWDALTVACQAAFALVVLLAFIAAARGGSRPALRAVLALAAYAEVYALGTVFARFNAPFAPLVYVAAGVTLSRLRVDSKDTLFGVSLGYGSERAGQDGADGRPPSRSASSR